MKFDRVQKYVEGVPYINPRNAVKLYNFLIENEGIQNVLELGFAHGTASCYMAAALEENGGHLVSVDLTEAASHFTPSIEELLDRTGLKDIVDVRREKTGYNWFLHNEIRANTSDNICQPKYDLCIIDGPKNWTIDGAAFFMVDKLLKKNGWVIFDDYGWTYASAAKQGSSSTDGIEHSSMSEMELSTPQIKEVFQLLVMQHPAYGNFRIHGEGDWAWAQKVEDPAAKKVTIEYNATYKDGFSRLFAMATKLLGVRKV